MAEGKSAVTPLSFWLHFAIDQTFKMRYITSLNSQWFEKYEPSKLKKQKKVPLPMEIEDFFRFSTLKARIF